MSATKVNIQQGKTTRCRSISLDPETEQILLHFSGGNVSAFLKKLVWQEVGRRQVLSELRGQENECDGVEHVAVAD